MNRLSTIGYEGSSLGDFLENLKLAGVDLLLDIRELPASRRKGFSKTALREALEVAGIKYRHEPMLGSPREIRHQLRKHRDYATFFSKFNHHLETQDYRIRELVGTLTGHIALLCFERNHEECHRTPVAEKFAEITGIRPRHIGVRNHAQRDPAATN